MAKHLDLEEQEQLDELKHFWKTYGNLITWALIAVLGVFAGWNAYQYWQKNQATQSAALFDEVERSATAGDFTRLERSLTDMKEKFGATTYASQAALLAAKAFFEMDKADSAKAALRWVAENAPDDGYRAVARLRLAGLLIGQKAYDDASTLLASAFPKEFEGLASDRRGDIASLQGKKSVAIDEYQKAYKLFDGQTDYRRLVEVKLNALGVDPLAGAPASADVVAAAKAGDKK